MITLLDPRALRRTQAWRKLAKQVIHEEHICWLRLPGCTILATTADHVIPIIDRPDLALTRSNVHAACRPCNTRRGPTPMAALPALRAHGGPQRPQRRRSMAAASYFGSVRTP